MRAGVRASFFLFKKACVYMIALCECESTRKWLRMHECMIRPLGEWKHAQIVRAIRDEVKFNEVLADLT